MQILQKAVRRGADLNIGIVSKPLEDYTPEMRELIRCKRKAYYLAHREIMLAQSKAAQQRRKGDPSFLHYRRVYYGKRRYAFALRLQETLFPLLESNPDISLDQIAVWLNEQGLTNFYKGIWTAIRVRNILKLMIDQGLEENDD